MWKLTGIMFSANIALIISGIVFLTKFHLTLASLKIEYDSYDLLKFKNQLKQQRIKNLTLESGFNSAPWFPNLTDFSTKDSEICSEAPCLDAAIGLLKSINFTIDPCKDFYEFACGNWTASHPLGNTSLSESFDDDIAQSIFYAVEAIIDNSTSTNDPIALTQAKEFYKECINEDKLESAGVTPLVQLVNEIVPGWPLLNSSLFNETEFSWVNSTAEVSRRLSEGAIVTLLIWRDMANNSRKIIYVDQPSLGISRPYLINATNHRSKIAAYKNYIVETVQELGSTEPLSKLQKAAKAILQFEIKLASLQLPPEEKDAPSFYKHYTVRELQKLTDEISPDFIDWSFYLKQYTRTHPDGFNITDDTEVAGPPMPYLVSLFELLKATPTRILAEYIGWRVVQPLTEDLNQGMRNVSAKFTQAFNGFAEPSVASSIEALCLQQTKTSFATAVGYQYINKNEYHSPDITKRDSIIKMAETIRSSFKEILQDVDWLDNSTKTEALKKADGMRFYIGNQNWVNDSNSLEDYYERIDLSSGPYAHFENVLRISQWENEDSYLSSNTRRNPSPIHRWISSIGAFYLTQANTIAIGAGVILEDEYFSKQFPVHFNYGRLGFVLGHEISHAFDTSGVYYDKDGNAQNWWQPETLKTFQQKVQCLIEQYGNYSLPSINNQTINGKLTSGENIADLGGVNSALKAYRQKVKDMEKQENKKEPKLYGMERISPDQMFFIGYATSWCSTDSKQGLMDTILTDPHSPAKYRVNGVVKNVPEFAQAFNCLVDSQGMNPPKSETCSVW